MWFAGFRDYFARKAQTPSAPVLPTFNSPSRSEDSKNTRSQELGNSDWEAHPLEFARKEQSRSAPPPSIPKTPSRPRCSNGTWPKEFGNTNLEAHPWFNKTYIDLLRSDWDAVDDVTDEGDDGETSDDDDSETEDANEDEGCLEVEGDTQSIAQEDQTVAGVFMKNRIYAEKWELGDCWHPGAEIVGQFCQDLTFDDLEKPDTEPGLLAHLEDSSRAGVFRQSMGPLNPRQLLHALREPRYDPESSLDSWQITLEPSTDQRRICFLNITPKMAAILMGTAPINEAVAVQDLLYKHIDRAPFLGVTVPTRGFRTFTFHLSIPSYTLSKGPQLVDDRRLGSNRLRETISIPGLGDFREAHTSIVLTGFNDLRWTAIALIDNGRPAIAGHGSGEDLPFRLRRDHIAGVNLFPENIQSKARPYFLWLWKERLGQILGDWAEVVNTINRAVRVRNHHDMGIMGSESNDEKIEMLARSITEVAQWGMLLNPMKTKLRSMLETWNNFRKPDGDKTYFEDQDEAMPDGNAFEARDSFGSLIKLYDRAELLLKELEDATSTLKSNLNQLNLAQDTEFKARADRRAIDLARAQEEAARSARRANVTTMCFLPAMVAFTLFSMEKTAIPVAANRESLLTIFAALGVLTIILFNYIDLIVSKGCDLCMLIRKFLCWLLSLRALQVPPEMV